MVNTFDDDHTKKTVLLAYQYDTLCWLYDSGAFDQAFQLSEIIGATKCDLMRLCTIQLAEYKDQEDRTSVARQKAAKRWQQNNEIKARLLAEWDREGDQYESKADFCRIIAQREGLIAKTLEIWIRTHSKKKS
ncbi:hypothetical protein [Pseudomonas oryzihabitans]|uniref:hypothetical protein n=1 Tax=Pseudomonas oryzihabitans TaxID=47885 RepID=UPI00289AC2C2|nr:hypothetical protein [Pseudomonas oryzihabitans]